MKKCLIKFLTFFIFILIIAFGIYKYKHSRGPRKNIIVISLCSVSTNQLPIYGKGDFKAYPNLSAFFNQSFNFLNAYTDFSWSNIRRFLYAKERKEKDSAPFDPKKSYYPPFEEWYSSKDNVNITSYRIPKIAENKDFESFSNDLRLDEAFDDLPRIQNEIKKTILSNKNNFFILHYKFMHFPFLPNKILNDVESMNAFFTVFERELIANYLNHPENYPEKLAFFQALFPFIERPNFYKNSNGQYITYIMEHEYLKKWKESKNYDDDYKILIKSYQLKLKLLDKLIGQWIDFYKKELEKENTILVFAGDHGEALLEHEVFTHNTVSYDEVIHFFFSVHYPGQDFAHNITEQVSQETTADILVKSYELNKNEYFTPNYFENYLTKNDVVVSFNCTGSVISARELNKWKLLYFSASDTYQLFDLASDPHELVDVSRENPDIVARLKIDIYEKLSKVKIRAGYCVYF